MYMNDWKNEVENALKVFHYNILGGKGSISHKQVNSEDLFGVIRNGILNKSSFDIYTLWEEINNKIRSRLENIFTAGICFENS